MSAAEKMAEQLEADSYDLPSRVQNVPVIGEWTPVNSCTDAADMIRRLAAALQDVMAYLPTVDRMAYEILTERHADALRDVKEQA